MFQILLSDVQARFRWHLQFLNQGEVRVDQVWPPTKAARAPVLVEGFVNFETSEGPALVIRQNHLAVPAVVRSNHPSRAANLMVVIQQTDWASLESPRLGPMPVEPCEPLAAGW